MTRIKTPQQLVKAYEKLGSLKAVSRQHNTPWGTVHRFYLEAVAAGMIHKLPRGAKTREHITDTIKGRVKIKPIIGGKRRATKAKPMDIAEKGVTRFLFTCAQNNTKLHDKFWNNLLAFKDHYGAELHVARFSYIKSGLGALGDKLTWFNAQIGESLNAANPHKDEFWFDPRIVPFISDEQRTVAPGLVWRGDANISPTAANPLNGKAGMTGRKSGIFPHTTIAMESVPSMEQSAVKFLYTTGTVTLRNYIQRDAGFKADFHHTYGALLVEVWNGHWWCRQINADSEGTFQDLDVLVKNGTVTTGNTVEAIVWGDVHVANRDEKACEIAWGEDGKGGVIDYLRPKHQFIHDILDMYARNHHDIEDPHQLHLRYILKKDNVRDEIAEVSTFLDGVVRPWCETHIVNSNHDRALLTWLRNKRGMFDPANFEFWSEMNARVTRYTREHGDFPVVLQEAYLEVNGVIPPTVTFLARDDQFIICENRGGGVECGEHGDDGANGARGTTAGYTKIGRRITKGHDHTAAIKQNVHSVGTLRKFRANSADYGHGPSSWSHSQDVIYPSAKRTIITFWRGLPWAPR